ncbi:MAG: ubiquinone/menaquinone biosynthesis methyltransferase [Desulfofustis sp.]|nr:ubiquinone/menaquinone biosynthesis methyltransferase [Desulfofustis sp.]
MFDAIADRYDLMNRVMTFGQDRRWKDFVVDRGGEIVDGWALDLACGTGEIAAQFRRSNPEARIVGADFSRNMLIRAQQDLSAASIRFQACDANHLPYRDGVFRAVSFGYLLRNVDDSLMVLKEVYRVLSEGGRVICLDTTPPARNLLYPLIRVYLAVVIPLLGRLIARDRSAYAYLTGSTMEFHDADTLARLFEEAGFSQVAYKKFMFGTIAVHWGTK